MNNINCVLEQKNNCCGCRACANVCPVGAIVMKEDDEGFFYPVIDSEKCTNCGLCKKVCPSLNKSEVFHENTLNPDCYAVMADDETRLVSSSGGAFTLIANKIFEMGGVVCGAAYVGQKVKHIIIENKDDLYKLRGSKYLQSDTNTVYSQIKNLLKDGKVVLFSGTPCQVAGLNTFLGKKYENLYTVDLLCHGVPPQKVFDKYLEETLQEDDTFYHTTFRDKKAGWGVYTTTTTISGKKYYGGPTATDTYLQAFIKNMCLRPSCGTCAYTTTQRESDITIGDFWAIERFDKKLNDNKGTSVILLNSKKGKELFDSFKGNVQVCTKVPLDYASYYNITLKTPLQQHPNRQAFFRMLKEGKSLKETVDYCKKNKYDCMIMNLWPFKNFGGVLNAYALQIVLKQLGYTSQLINYYHFASWRLGFKDSFVEHFANKYLNFTKPYYNIADLQVLNAETDTFIVGSDCVWCTEWFKGNSYMLPFCDGYKKKISYAPSFGNKNYINTFNQTQINKYFLDKFDSVSVREDVGVSILKEKFNIKATQVLDPTLLLSNEKYDSIIEESGLTDKDFILDYSIGTKKDYNDLKIHLNSKFEDIITFSQSTATNTSVADWLYYIKNSKLVITNSYHALCFALIFNKPFWLLSPSAIDNSRLMSLLKIVGLENRFITNVDEFDIDKIFEPIDWERVNSIIAQEKERSLKWLKDALEAPKDLSKINPADAVIKSLNDKVQSLQASAVRYETLKNVLNYNKNYRKYLKYKILKNFVFGKTRDRYKRKSKELHEKIRSARRVK